MRSTLRSFGIAALFAALAAPAFAQAAPAPAKAPVGTYVLDKPHSSIDWKILHQGMSWYTARFTKYDITLDFNADDVSKSKVTATIDPKSVLTDDAAKRPDGKSTFDKELGEDTLGGAKGIKFISTKIEKTGEKTGKMTGDLTFLGVTKPVTLDVVFNGGRSSAQTQNKFKAGFTATTTLNQADWGLNGPGSVAQGVKIEINAEFVQK
ncbi:MAG TPA: YceI family protein [Hyphomonadaceae bacterium]|nr:YceI family protein [Hyphomonadaceae bacterium]